MRRLLAINLIAFCTLILLVDDSSVTKAYALKDYFRKFYTSLKELTNLRHGILPGTRWCGRGNIAYNDTEYGVYRGLDKCCMAHDLCDDYIRPKSERYGLYNKYICRSSLCECELQFYDCLKQVRGIYAGTVGKLYFAKCKQCFRLYHDIGACVREGLDMNEGVDRKGRRIFCAKFERNPKWRGRYNVTRSVSTLEHTTSTSGLEPIAWDDDESSQPISRSLSTNDNKYYGNGEDGAAYGDYASEIND